MTEQITEINGIRIAYQDHPGPDPALLLLHGLTANQHSFDGLLAAGLAQGRRVIVPDLRGRGQSGKPVAGYSLAEHAQDILGLMDSLSVGRAVLIGHSFGGMLSMWLAAHAPDRVHRLVLIDAAVEAADPSVMDKIRPSLDRLGQTVPSWEAYIDAVKAAPPYADFPWDAHIEAYYRADVETLPDGSVRARASRDAIEEAAQSVIATDWAALVPRIQQPALLLHAPAPFGPPGAPPVVTTAGAQETARLIPHCRYQAVPGNHITLLFGENAPQVVRHITAFLDEPQPE